jgi:hypothetical protein
VNDTPFAEYERLVERYGRARAERMMKLVLKNYTRLALISTGNSAQASSRAYARRMAERFGLRYEEIPGSNDLIRKMIHGPWDDDFVIARPGQRIRYTDFKRVPPKTGS